MASAIRLGDANSGFQAGVINGPVNAAFHHHAAPEPLESPPNPSALIPFSRDPDFIERGPILDQLRQKCATPGSRTALVGLGGVGKSQLAIEWAHRTRDRSPETWVFWVHASNAARFEQSFRDMADCAKIAGRRNVQATIFKLVHDWLRNERHGKWVLILDNVDDAGFLVGSQSTGEEGHTQGLDDGSARPLREYIPHCPHGSVLITTRSRSAALKLVEEGDSILVEPMDEVHATALLKKKLENVEEKLGIKFPDEDVADLAATLEFMPLAIVQAAAYISERAPNSSSRLW
ncbi:hypothetical protein LTS15_007597 [Exophiala xenobiotica]|nr:hypothetical protein LTS15_007597 [Exophiala xenobiotica]